MDSKYSLSVIVPVFNEENNISPLYRELTEVLVKMALPYEIIFIDDGSSDNSYQFLTDLHTADGKVRHKGLRQHCGCWAVH